jgi:hypothetical protein
LEEKKAKASA